MSQFKPLSEKIANKMITDLKTGNSIFQRPDINANSALPFNIESGKNYTGPSALVLLMQKRDDPRWGTSNQANRNHTAVVKGATGTWINFMTNYEIQKVFKDGEPVLKENGKQRTERVKLDQPKEVDSCLFNGEQMRKLPKWEKEPALVLPAERAAAILDNSKVAIEQGGDDMLYDAKSDTILLPEKEQFASPEQYYAEAIHQLAHRTAAQELGQSQENSVDQSANSKLELRTNLASLFLSKELNLPYDLNYQVGYTNSWGQIMKDEPGELFNAAADAQKIVDRVLGFEQIIEEKQETEQENQVGENQEEHQGHENDTPKENSVAAGPSFNPDKLNKGEIIPYEGKEFKVVAELKNNVYSMVSEGRKFKMSAKDNLFGFLLEARNFSQENVISRETNAEDAEQEHFEAEEENQGYSMSI